MRNLERYLCIVHRVPICRIGKFTKEKNLERTQKRRSNFLTECQHLTSLSKADEGDDGGAGDNDNDNDGDDDNDGDGGETEHESGQETWEEEPP